MNKFPKGYIKETIMKNIESSQPHSIFFISDFIEIGSYETIRRILTDATYEKKLERIGKGIYVKPKHSRFGTVPPPLENVAKEIAKRDKSEILPTGGTAANLIGLSTQVPMNLSYITTGSTRTIRIGNRKLHFRHAAPKNFAGKGWILPLMIQGLKETGEENIKEEQYTAIKKFLEEKTDPYLREDLYIAPAWIQKIIKDALL